MPGCMLSLVIFLDLKVKETRDGVSTGWDRMERKTMLGMIEGKQDEDKQPDGWIGRNDTALAAILK